MACITRNKADTDVVQNIANNEVGTVRNQAPNLEALIALTTQTVHMWEDVINKVSAIEMMLKTNTKYLSLRERDLHLE
jgi:hypothetical protein